MPGTVERNNFLNILYKIIDNKPLTMHESTQIDIGSERFVSFFSDEILNGFIKLSGSTCRFLTGGQRSGKTHVKNILMEKALQEGYLCLTIDLSSDFNFKYPYFAFLSQLSQQIWTKYDKDPLHLVDLLDTINDDALPDIASEKLSNLPHPSAAQAMIYATKKLEPIQKELLNNFFAAKPVLGELKKKGMPLMARQINRRNSQIAFTTIVTGLKRLGIPGLVIFFDQTDSNKNFTASQISYLAQFFRNFIDNCTNRSFEGVCMVTTLDESLLARIREYNPLNQRISRPDINYNDKFPWRVIIVHIKEINSFFNSISELKGNEPFSLNAIDKYLHLLLNESQFNKREKTIKRRINSELSLKDNSSLDISEIIQNTAQALVQTLIKGVSS
jgi:hypothetical protein